VSEENTAAIAVVKEEMISDEAMDDILQQGDMTKLTIRQRSQFAYKMAERLGLNPLTKPFDFINLGGKLTLYANRTASDQLRQIHHISSRVIYAGPLLMCDPAQALRSDIDIASIPSRDDVYQVIVLLTGKDKDGEERTEMAVGCVGIQGMSGEALANAVMKCHTKALRRGTLSFAGLGFLDELEVESVKSMQSIGSAGAPRRVAPTMPTSSPSSVPNSPAAASPAPSTPRKPLPSAPAPVRVKP
jgi:hypothetical protein